MSRFHENPPDMPHFTVVGTEHGFVQLCHSDAANVIEAINCPEMWETMTEQEVRACLSRYGCHEGSTSITGSYFQKTGQVTSSVFVTKDHKVINLYIDLGGWYTLSVLVEDAHHIEQIQDESRKELRMCIAPDCYEPQQAFLVVDPLGHFVRASIGCHQSTKVSGNVDALLLQIASDIWEPMKNAAISFSDYQKIQYS